MFIDVSIVKKWPMFDNEHRVNSRSVVIIAFITSGQNPLSVLGDQILGGQKSLSVSWKPNDSGHASRLPLFVYNMERHCKFVCIVSSDVTCIHGFLQLVDVI